jgi:hypothetical protein
MLGAAWLLFTLGPPTLFIAFGDVFVHAIVLVFCDTGRCRPGSVPVSIAGVACAAAALCALGVMFAVPHRGGLRWARGGLLACIAVLGLVAEAQLFTAVR